MGILGGIKRAFIRDRTLGEESAWQARKMESKREAANKVKVIHSRKPKVKTNFIAKFRKFRKSNFGSSKSMNFKALTGATSGDFNFNVLSGGGGGKKGKNMWSGLSGLVK